MDKENFKYYKSVNDQNVKKSLDLKSSEAYLEEKSDFMKKQKSGQN